MSINGAVLVDRTGSPMLGHAGAAAESAALRGDDERSIVSGTWSQRSGYVDGTTGTFRSSTPGGASTMTTSPQLPVRQKLKLAQGSPAARQPTARAPESSLLHSKMKFYTALRAAHMASPGRHRRDSQFLRPPSHVLPPLIFGLQDAPGTTQSSYTTISTMVNTMIGTTIVALPYGMAQAGIAAGLAIICGLGAIACFTCVLVVKHGKDSADFIEFVQEKLGTRWKFLSWGASIMVMVGACCVYHILMQQSLYEAVWGVLDSVSTGNDAWWSRTLAAGIPALVALPFASLEDLSKLVKVNSYGTIFVVYTIAFIVTHGLRAIFTGKIAHPSPVSPAQAATRTPIEWVANLTFGTMAGMALLSFFIHNCILPITKHAVPETKRRDIMIAFSVVGTLYGIIGTAGYLGFADTETGAVQPNFLEAFPRTLATRWDWYAFSARVSLLLQLLAVFPVLLYIVRSQLLGLLLDSAHPNNRIVVAVNAGLLGVTCTFAALNINVAVVTRFVGAICGAILIFAVPLMIDRLEARTAATYPLSQKLLHVAIASVGALALLCQFIPGLA